MVKESHKKEIIQNEKVSEIERFDVVQLDQHLQEHLAHSQTLIKHEWPELLNVGEKNRVHHAIIKKLDESLPVSGAMRHTRMQSSRTSTCWSYMRCVVI